MLAAHATAVEALFAQLATRAPDPIRYGRVGGVQGPLVEVDGLDAAAGSLVRIETRGARPILGEVCSFRGSRLLVAPFARADAITPGALVSCETAGDGIEAGDAVLGRTLGPLSEPVDGLGPIANADPWSSVDRASARTGGRVEEMCPTGLRAIDALLTLGAGQRVALIAGAGGGKSVLLRQIAGGCDADVVVTALIGERAREVADFQDSVAGTRLAGRMVTVVASADRSPMLRIRAAHRANALASYFRARGQRVLLLMDSLTRIAHAQREIGLAQGEPPTMKGYPPSALGLIPSLVEQAGRDPVGGGSVTALYTVLADQDDLTDPVVDAARAITDGHIVLSRDLAENGVFPAIDVARSLSRVMHDIVPGEQAAASRRFRALWSTYEKNRDLVAMGAHVPGSDPALDDALARREAMLAFVRQDAGTVADSASSVAALIEGFGA